ncbi:MAG: hypothetical protein MRY77_06110, partial [Rhodobacteraceae bacterium]|nr:hypothetical protein [Paracoccaceae bacterium]
MKLYQVPSFVDIDPLDPLDKVNLSQAIFLQPGTAWYTAAYNELEVGSPVTVAARLSGLGDINRR